ncbi:MAG: response regulator [Thiohalocapsa sp.]|jgi:PAS domain S-box-containing protein|uniref:ATP-binding response regulator n=1 Tax=Thiohalocapsa sp. TaxID=2497641 RepID=UPI0025DE6E69|nr:response regulator [Thiohalocapsa sp.]MCG6940435.1 response regulator [Thiohalocapsa sp.]
MSDAPDRPAPAPTAAPAAAPDSANPPCVLLVDDIPANLRVLYESLNGRDYRLLVANGGAQALDIAERSRPDLILLDIMMPDMDGFEVCRRLKENADTADIAVVFLSALDDAADKIHGLELGAVDYVTKPFHPDEVAARVETHCKILRLERELGQRNRQLELVRDRILHSMVEGVVGLDVEGRVSFFNPAAERMLGQAAARLLTHEIANWEPAPLRDTAITVLAERREVSVDELALPQADGSTLPVELRAAPIADADYPAGAVLVLRDLSERRRVEAKLHRTSSELSRSHRELRAAQMQLVQAAKLESVGRLAAGVAHEVKNPLAIVQLGLDFLEQVISFDEISTQVLADMQQALSRADTVVRGLLDFSRERELDLRPYAVNKAIRNSLQLVRHELTQRNIAVRTELDVDIPDRPFDADKLQQVFLNLFMNAMHAMERDGTLSIRSDYAPVTAADLGPHARDAGFLPGEHVIRIAIEDTGPGIAPADLGRLFDPYFTTKRQGEGTGLGLSVTRNIVTLHGGSIDLENRPDGGARALLLFPPQNAPADTAPQQAESVAIGHAHPPSATQW